MFFQPPHHDEPPTAIEPWMTPKFVAHAWHIPPEIVADTLGLDMPKKPGGRITLHELADERGVDPEVLILMLEQAIQEFELSK